MGEILDFLEGEGSEFGSPKVFVSGGMEAAIEAVPGGFCDFDVAHEVGHDAVTGDDAGVAGFDSADEAAVIAAVVAAEDHVATASGFDGGGV